MKREQTLKLVIEQSAFGTEPHASYRKHLTGHATQAFQENLFFFGINVKVKLVH